MVSKKKLIILSFVAIVLVGSAGLFTYIGTPNGCLLCHEMTPFYDTWEVSAHQEVDCHDCHHQSDIGSYINELVVHIQGVNASEIEIDSSTPLLNEQCIVCHSNLTNKLETPSDISCFSCHDIAHYEHVVKITGDYDCSTCHDDHTMTVKEATCITCHNF